MSNPPIILQQKQRDPVPSAMMETTGTLVQSEEGCLFLDSESGRWLIFWPPETLINTAGGRLTFTAVDGKTFTVGDRIAIGGTGSENAPATSLGEVEIPPACRGRIWITNTGGVRLATS